MPTEYLLVLSNAVKVYQLLDKFVTDDMARILDEIGKSQYRAAARSLQDAATSNSPRDEILMTVTNLRSAYSAFKPSQDSWWHRLLGERGNLKDAAECAALIALCYKYLRNYPLMQKWVENCASDFCTHRRRAIRAVATSPLQHRRCH